MCQPKFGKAAGDTIINSENGWNGQAVINWHALSFAKQFFFSNSPMVDALLSSFEQEALLGLSYL